MPLTILFYRGQRIQCKLMLIFTKDKNVVLTQCITPRTVTHPFLQQVSGQIFKDDVDGFFLHLGYPLHACGSEIFCRIQIQFSFRIADRI
jgi:hypothetical protein